MEAPIVTYEVHTNPNGSELFRASDSIDAHWRFNKKTAKKYSASYRTYKTYLSNLKALEEEKVIHMDNSITITDPRTGIEWPGSYETTGLDQYHEVLEDAALRLR